MNRSKGRTARTAWQVAAWGVLAAGALLAPDAMAQTSIRDTKHNLGTTGAATNTYQFSGTDEVCVFCHTPHGSDTIGVGSAVEPDARESEQLHDLRPARHVVARRQGRPRGLGLARVPVVPRRQPRVQRGDQRPRAAAPRAARPGWPARSAGAFDRDAGRVDRQARHRPAQRPPDQHPVRRRRLLDRERRHAGNLGADKDFAVPRNTLLGVDAGCGGSTAWPARPGRARRPTCCSTRARPPRATPARPIPEPYVECASCHDPHQAANPTFLRIPNTGSQLCLTCHVK